MRSLHLHDNDGVNDTHQAPREGTGTIDWSQFTADLKTARYKGPIMYEVGYIRPNEVDRALDDVMKHYHRVFGDINRMSFYT